MAATESSAMMAPAVIKLDIMVEIATPSFLLTNGISLYNRTNSMKR